MNVNIIGAGMAGLLAANMLRRYEPTIFEAGQSLPNNHDALLRFRSDVVSRATGIPFKKVRVSKAIYFEGNLYDRATLRFNNLYSHKVTGEVLGRSILNLDTVDRFIAPKDFISRLAANVNIKYGVRWNPANVIDRRPTISTVPMPLVMNMVGWYNIPEFRSRNIAVITFDITAPNVDVYQTIYYPGNELYYRASITGNHVMVELCADNLNLTGIEAALLGKKVLEDFGIITEQVVANFNYKLQQYGKIAPVDDQKRKEFILAMSDKYNVYSLGRFGTWRQILMDDLVPDVELIDHMITQRSNYSQHLAMARN